MMEDDTTGEILKADVQKENDAAPPVALWDSWFYRSWKAYRAIVHPLAENWRHLLGIFWKFSLRWWKRRQIRSWISFSKRYHISPHITHMTCIKGQSVSHIKKGGEVDTQKLYQWSDKGRYCYIRWSSQHKVSMPIIKDCHLPMR